MKTPFTILIISVSARYDRWVSVILQNADPQQASSQHNILSRG